MYSRQLVEPPASLIVNGHPVFGSFNGHVAQLDIRGLRAPFGGVPLPSFISNFRIKSTLSFSFNVDKYLCSILFFDGKIIGLAEINLWNKETNRKYVYKVIMGPRRRFIPHNLEQGFCASFNRHRYIRISWDHVRDRISVIFNLKGDSVRPSVQAALSGHLNDGENCEITQCVPIKSKRRCAASFLATPTIHGSITIGKTKKSPGTTYNAENGRSMFFISRAYFDYVSHGQLIYACGQSDGKNISFILANDGEHASDPELSNRNLLIVDGQCTTLPTVRMTQPLGINKNWIIQDTENMVDLTFEPVSLHFRDISMFIMKFRMNIIYGKFEGVLKTKDGADIKISGLAGIARDQMIRV